MSQTPKIATLLALTAAALWSQAPELSSVQNPASNIPAALPNGGIAQGSIFVIYGKNLGPASIVQASAVPLPTADLGGTSIQISVNGTTVSAPMIYTLATQVAAILPSDTPVGSGTLTVAYEGSSGSIPITVVQSNFGISTVNETGTGPGVITRPDYTLITADKSAKPNDTVVLWGTGLGPVQGGDAVTPVAKDLATPIEVYVGSARATVTYRGRSGAPGLDQINVQVPAGVSGCSVPVVVQTGSTVSNFVTMAVSATGGACSDSNGVSSPPASGANGNVRLGSIIMSQITTYTPAIGTIPPSTSTLSYAGAGFSKYTGLQQSQSATTSGQPSIGGCLVTQFSGTAPAGTTPPSPLTVIGLDAGPSVSIAGPVSLRLDPLKGDPGGYYGSSTAPFPAGTYTISNGAGGADVPPFMTTLRLPAPFTWTNQASTLKIQKNQPLTIAWTGGDATSYVYIGGSSFTGTSTIVGASFACTAPVSAGQFTVPTAVLLSLPASSVNSLGIANAYLTVGTYLYPQVFAATGLDLAYASFSSSSGNVVLYQ